MHIKIVPEIVAGGGSDGLASELPGVLLANLLHKDEARRGDTRTVVDSIQCKVYC